MNPYFEENDNRFRQAIETLHRDGYDACQEIIKEALLLDPYRLEMHYELALYFASVKELARFEDHFRHCRTLDPSCGEKILTSDVVVNAFSGEEITGILSPKDKGYLERREKFTAIDPVDDLVFLRFKPGHKNDIEAIYRSLNAGVCTYLDLDQPPPVSFGDYYDDPDFTKIDYFILDNNSDRVYADAPVEDLIAALRRLSSHVEDVRFLMVRDQSSYLDEVIIRNGLLHLYRHDLDDDYTETQREYFETIANRYDDVMIRQWLAKEYLNDALFHMKYNYGEVDDPLVLAQQAIDNATRLASPVSAFLPYVKGMLLLKQNDPKAAIPHFREAAAKSSEQQIDFFDPYYELGKWLVLETTDYSESIEHLSTALQIKPWTDIYSYRALAFLKLNRIDESVADIYAYIDKIKPHDNSLFLTAARLFSEAGFNGLGDRFLHAGLEKNQLYENELIEKREKDTGYTKTYPNKISSKSEFYDSQLSKNAQTRLSLYNALSIKF